MAALILERDRAYQRILDLIMAGNVELDEALSERKLADSLEIGRTPVREAMRDLARDGVLEVRPARGTYVRSLSEDDIRQIYEAREGLEGFAAALAAERGPTRELQQFGPMFQGMLDQPEAHSVEGIHEAGVEFHTEVVRSARNRQLLSVYRPLRLRNRLALALPRYFDSTRVRAALQEHFDILDRIEARDPAGARDLMVLHLQAGAQARLRLLRHLGSVPADRPPPLPLP